MARTGWLAGGALAVGGVAVRRALRARGRRRWPRTARRSRAAARRPTAWQVVTVDRPPAEVLPDGRLPEPLARLGPAVEVRVAAAPGDRGTELAARPRGGTAPLTGMAAHLVGDDPGLLIRSALHRARQLAETGEELRADRPPFERRPGPPGARGPAR